MARNHNGGSGRSDRWVILVAVLAVAVALFLCKKG